MGITVEAVVVLQASLEVCLVEEENHKSLKPPVVRGNPQVMGLHPQAAISNPQA